MIYTRNESSLKQLKKDELLQLICSDILAFGICIRLASKKSLIRMLNGLDDILTKCVEEGIN